MPSMGWVVGALDSLRQAAATGLAGCLVRESPRDPGAAMLGLFGETRFAPLIGTVAPLAPTRTDPLSRVLLEPEALMSALPPPRQTEVRFFRRASEAISAFSDDLGEVGAMPPLQG